MRRRRHGARARRRSSALAYAIDPYDTGRSSLFAKHGVRYQGPRTAAASRGRDPAFDAGIFGNSHIQLLSPERLKEKTGLDFVQLSVPGSGPREQFVVLDWFLRHRQAPVRGDRPLRRPDLVHGRSQGPGDRSRFRSGFSAPARSNTPRGLLRYDILEELPRRLGYLLGRPIERARPDGYFDYEAGYLTMGYKVDPEKLEKLEKRVPDNWPVNVAGQFPVADWLREVAANFPADTAVLLIFPPSYKAALPSPESIRGRSDRACKDALQNALADSHPKTAVIDWRLDRPENHRIDLYFDQTHYRQPIAQAIENDIADALRRMK